jgi:mannose/cellobiose epimerase-like protein (N-acyl-D-glucosamine 2-epimerase family)
MAVGYEVTGERVYYDAMIKAADFLLENYAEKKVPGRWANLVGPDGKVLAAQFHAYGYTHVIFALAHAYRASKDKKYLDAAFATWLQLDLRRTLQGRNPEVKLHGLNVAMHAFEGLLALYKADHSNLVLDDLKLLGEYILGNFFDSQRGFFYEELDANLRPRRRAIGQITGHNRNGLSVQQSRSMSIPEEISRRGKSCDRLCRPSRHQPCRWQPSPRTRLRRNR